MAVISDKNEKSAWERLLGAMNPAPLSLGPKPEKAGPGEIIKDRSDLPNRNWEILWGGMPNTPAGKKLREEYPKLSNLFNVNMYLDSAYEHPQNVPEAVWSGVRTWLKDKSPFDWDVKGFLGWNSDDGEEGEFNPWEQEYLAWKNGTGADGGAYNPLAGSPFPSVGGYSPDWKALREAANIEAPKYHEKAFNPMNTVANMLMNMDWINMDMSRAGKIMQDAFNRRADDNANVANKTEEAKYQAARDKLNTALAFEKLKAEQAQQAAALAIKRWESMQPKALGGNKMYWRDSNGGLHFEAVDKQGEARTLGGNEALAMLMDKSPKELKKMTYNDIVKLAKTRGSIWLQDKASYVPWLQGFILQAQMMKNSNMDGEK